jgi:hypothetical protein
MKKVKVFIPFYDAVDGRLCDVDDVVELSDERIAKIKADNVNMVLVIDDDTETEAEKKTTTRSKKENA